MGDTSWPLEVRPIDIYERFFSRYLPGRRPRPRPALAGPAALQEVQDRLAAMLKPIRLPSLTQDDRDELAGKRFPALSGLLLAIADGLLRCPEIAADLDTDPEVYLSAAGLDWSLGGFIFGMQTIAARADIGLLHAAAAADELCQAAQAESKRLQDEAPPGAPPPEVSVVRFALAEPIRLRADAWQRAHGAAERQAPPDRKDAERVRLISGMIEDVRAGRDSFVHPGVGEGATTQTGRLASGARGRPAGGAGTGTGGRRRQGRRRPLDLGALLSLLGRADGRRAGAEDDLQASLLLRPDELDATLPELAAITVKLPEDDLEPSRKGVYRKLTSAEYGTVVRAFASAVRRCHAVLGPTELRLPDPARMEALGETMDLFEEIHLHALQGAAKARCLRLLVGGFEWFLLGQAYAAVKKRMEDPRTSKAQRARLELAFMPILLNRGELIAQRAEARKKRQRDKEKEAARRAESERMILLLDTLRAIRTGLPVDDETLARAAEIYAEEKQKRAAGAPMDASPGGSRTGAAV